MNRREALGKINATLKEQGFSEKSAIVLEFEGRISVHGKPIDVAIEIPDITFVKLPKVKLKDPAQLDPEIVGHLFNRGDGDSGICYASAVGLPLDIYDPGGSVLRVLEQAKVAMEVNYKGRGVAEVAAEYQDYWRDGIESFRILIKRPTSDTATLKTNFYRFKAKGMTPFLGLRDVAEFGGFSAEEFSHGQLIFSNEPLSPVGKIKVPLTLEQFEIWFRGQPGFTDAEYSQAFAALAARNIVAIDAPNCVLGVRLDFPRGLEIALNTIKTRKAKIPELIANRKSEINLTRFGGFWCDQKTLAERNLVGMNTLAGKKIALIGCGTLGSHLAKFLVQSGAGFDAPLYLFDGQGLSAGNVGRHYLGIGQIDKAKAEALCDELKRFHPDIDVRAICRDVFDDWNTAKDCDLIIDATGDWNTQNAVNEAFLNGEDVKAEAVLYSWICGNGAAAQGFLSIVGDGYCFRCLRPDAGKNWRYTALKPKYEEIIEEATCGDGAYYPYSVAAPAIAAGLSTEMILGWANGKPGSRLKTIVIDHERGAERQPTTPSPAAACPACAARDSDD
tara:strand:+ start:542 stop:2221 length:1680 start_codon:yes stop_codon:yes gene_type:complete